jgi:hypothetical protein
MKTKRLQEVVDMVSSILTDFPVHPKTLQNKIVISTPIWDFYLTRINGCYMLDDTKINDGSLSEEYNYAKDQICREVFGRYCVTISL